MNVLDRWAWLVAEVNGTAVTGMPGVRDPDSICEEFDGLGYQGDGQCLSDGHYLCQSCSKLSPEAEILR
jgi:hypothetical protein